MVLGKKKHARVAADDRIVLKGVVRSQDASRTVAIQELQGGGRFGIPRTTKGRWKTIKKVTHDGRSSVKRTVSWGQHVFRAKVKLGKQATAASDGSLAATSGSAASPTAPSTAGSWGYGYIFANDTGRDLQLTYTNGTASGGSQSSSPVTFDDEVLLLAVLGNPPANLASAFTLEGKEAGISYTYK